MANRTQKTQNKPEPLGNTSTRGYTNHKTIRSRKWCITLNNYTETEYKFLLDTINTRNYSYIIGREIGKQNKIPHLQIYIETKNPTSFNTIKNINNRLHIEKARGNRKQNIIYCSKENNYKTNFADELVKDRLTLILEAEYDSITWKDWQLQIIEITNNKPDKRKIYWYWEEIGNVGKSFLIKYLALKFPDKIIIGNGKKANVFNQILTHINKGLEPECILIDIPRENKDYFNYGCIEAIKNGCFYSGKYEGGICLFKIPHIIIVSNEEPNYNKFSHDRYEIYNITT